MSYFSDFGGAFFNSLAADSQAKRDDNRALDKYKKQLEIQDELRKKAEEAKVAATKMFKKPGDPNQQSPWVSKEASGYVKPQGGADQWMVEEFNSQGKPIGVRPASITESESGSKGELATLYAQQEAQRKLSMEDEDRSIKKRKDEAYINRQNAASESSRASAEYMRKGGATPKGMSYEEGMKKVVNLLGDPDYRAAVQAADPGALNALGMSADGSLVKGVKAVASYLGVMPQTENADALDLRAQLAKEQDPEIRAQMVQDYIRRLELAAASARARGIGIKSKQE